MLPPEVEKSLRLSGSQYEENGEVMLVGYSQGCDKNRFNCY
jgi:hypothetical protein